MAYTDSGNVSYVWTEGGDRLGGQPPASHHKCLQLWLEGSERQAGRTAMSVRSVRLMNQDMFTGTDFITLARSFLCLNP